jgi:hypothetical protein
MATLPLQQRVMHRPNRVYDRVFFSAMSLVILATVLFGFSKTYFMAGMVRAPLPNALIHVHGAAFTLWIVLLIVQTALISTRNIRIHRTLGMGGFCLALAMVGLGIWAAVDALHRGSAPLGLDAKTFFIIPITAIALFACFIAFAYRDRSRPEAHKRLILIGTISLMDAAVGRWPIAILQATPPLQDLVILAFLLVVVAFDVVSLRRVSKTTIWASAVVIVVHVARVPFGHTAVWHAVADFALGKH